MSRPYVKILSWLPLLSVLFLAFPSLAWHDKTHLAISQAAGYEQWYNSAGPDITKTKANDIESPNHWFNNHDENFVTDKMVLAQVERYIGENNFNNGNRHKKNDGIAECSVLNNIGFIQRNIYEIKIENDRDLAWEIARIANISRRWPTKWKKRTGT